ncbi:hypothetical protein [uncultured Desulfobacter sp.]|uniref:hypothetical protein n=1 Tax=uncultured Desulfobacter sp. TaxID=240139 RepID=UPI0029C85143|nr:hypothetical protein [uncultured Desulfobacter sp.]
MSRYCGDRDSRLTIEAAEHWRQHGLLEDGSILTGKSLWKLEHLQALDQYFINQLDDGEGNFFEKFSRQLAPTAPEVKQLAAEILWVMLLCPSNISGGRVLGGPGLKNHFLKIPHGCRIQCLRVWAVPGQGMGGSGRYTDGV